LHSAFIHRHAVEDRFKLFQDISAKKMQTFYPIKPSPSAIALWAAANQAQSRSIVPNQAFGLWRAGPTRHAETSSQGGSSH
jgi:hypothetical protein